MFVSVVLASVLSDVAATAAAHAQTFHVRPKAGATATAHLTGPAPGPQRQTRTQHLGHPIVVRTDGRREKGVTSRSAYIQRLSECLRAVAGRFTFRRDGPYATGWFYKRVEGQGDELLRRAHAQFEPAGSVTSRGFIAAWIKDYTTGVGGLPESKPGATPDATPRSADRSRAQPKTEEHEALEMHGRLSGTASSK